MAKSGIVAFFCALIAIISGAGGYAYAAEPVKVSIAQYYDDKGDEPGTANPAYDIIDWWFELDTINHTATLVHPPKPSDGLEAHYTFQYKGEEGRSTDKAGGGKNIFLWSPSTTGLFGNSSYFTAIKVPSKFKYPNSEGVEFTVTALGDSAFYKSNASYIHIPSTITKMGDYAFAFSPSLVGTNVTSSFELVPSSVDSIGEHLFEGCRSLNRLEIGDSVEVLPVGSLYECIGLNELSLGKSVKRVECVIHNVLKKIVFKSPESPTFTNEWAAEEVWVPEEYLAAYTAAFSGMNIKPYSLKPKTSSTDMLPPDKLKFYTNFSHSVDFEINASSWKSDDDINNYYFVYRAVDFGGFGIRQEVSRPHVGPGGVDLPYTILFSDPAVGYIHSPQVSPVSTDSKMYIGFNSPGNYQVTVRSNDVTRASYTWDVEVVDGIPVTSISVSGPAIIAPGEKGQFIAKCESGLGEDVDVSDDSVIWWSDDETVLTIDPVTGEATGIADGGTWVHAKSLDPASPDVERVVFVRVNGTGAIYTDSKAAVPAASTNFTLPDFTTRLDVDSVTTRWWYFLDKDGNCTLTYPGAGIADYDGSNSYDFEYVGHDYIRVGTGSNQVIALANSAMIFSEWAHHTSDYLNHFGYITPLDVPEQFVVTRVINGIPQGTLSFVKKIGDRAFAGSNVEYINIGAFLLNTLPNQCVTEIGEYAFEDCKQFKGIPEGSDYDVVSDRVTKIGRGLFKGCSAMEIMMLGDGITEVPEETFDGCTSLRQLRIGASVTNVKCNLKASEKIAFASIAVPAIEPGYSIEAPEILVPAQSLEDYKAAWPTLNIKPYSLTIGDDENEEYGTYYDSPLRHLPVNLQTSDLTSGNKYRAAYQTGVYGNFDIPVFEFPSYPASGDNAPAYVINFNTVSELTTLQPYESNVALKFKTPQDEPDKVVQTKLSLRSMDITRANKEIIFKAKAGLPISKIVIRGQKTIGEGRSAQLTVDITPKNASDQRIVWSSSDEEVCTVDPHTGLVTGRIAGEATITATSIDPFCDHVSATFTVIVSSSNPSEGSTNVQTHLTDNDLRVGKLTRTETAWSHFSLDDKFEAQLTFPDGTGGHMALVQANGPEVIAKPYNFGFPGYDAVYVAGEGYRGWHKQVPSDDELPRRPNNNPVGLNFIYFTALEIPEEIVGDNGLPYKMGAITAGTFARSNVRYVHVPSTVTEIGDYAFSEAKDFMGLSPYSDYDIIPPSVNKMGKAVFKGCDNLRIMDIGDGVEIIPEETFDACPSLTRVGIGSSVKQINCNIAASDDRGNLHELEHVAFRSEVPPTFAKGCELWAKTIWVPEESIEAYKEAFSRVAHRIRGFKFKMKNNKVKAYPLQLRRVDFDRNTLMSNSAVTFATMYPAESEPYGYNFTVNAYNMTSAHGTAYYMYLSDPSAFQVANGVQNTFARFKFNKTGTYTVNFREMDITRAEDTVEFEVIDGVPVNVISIEGDPSAAPGDVIQLKAIVRGPADPNNINNRLTPSNADVYWVSSDPDIATVHPTLGTVTINKNLSPSANALVTITAQSADPCCDEIKAVHRIRVGQAYSGFEVYLINDEGERERKLDGSLGLYGYPGQNLRFEIVHYPQSLPAPHVEITTDSPLNQNITVSPDDNNSSIFNATLGDVNKTPVTLTFTLPAFETADDKPIVISMPLVVKQEMKDIEVTVPSNPDPVDTENPLEGNAGDSQTLDVTIDRNATDRYVVWKSSDESIVEVHPMEMPALLSLSKMTVNTVAVASRGVDLVGGNSDEEEPEVKVPDCHAVLVMKKRGRAIITASDPDGRGAIHSFPVEVTQLAEALQLFAEGSNEPISSNFEILHRSELKLNHKVLPEDANVNDLHPDYRLRYESSNDSVLTIDPDGTIHFVGVGKATIKAEVADKSGIASELSIVVNPILIKHIRFVGAPYTGDAYTTMQLNPVITPANASFQNLRWTSLNEDAATVDQNGKVTLLAEGQTIIRAEAMDGSDAWAECLLNVNYAEPPVVEKPDPGEEEKPEQPEPPEEEEKPTQPTTPEKPDESQEPDNNENPDDPVTPPTTEDPEPEIPNDPAMIDGVEISSVSVSVCDDNIIVSGASAGLEVSVFNISGVRIAVRKSDGSDMIIPINRRGVYIVVAGKVYKVVV